MVEEIRPKIAFIIDDHVVEILNTDTRLAAMFLSDPIMVDVTDQEGVTPGMIYDKKSNSFALGL